MKQRNVINPDGKGPRIWCGRCARHVPAQQAPWPSSRYVAKQHTHSTKEN